MYKPFEVEQIKPRWTFNFWYYIKIAGTRSTSKRKKNNEKGKL